MSTGSVVFWLKPQNGKQLGRERAGVDPTLQLVVQDATMIWTSFLYQYTVGGLIFLVGMIYAAKQGEVGFRTRPARKNLILLCGGFLAMFLLHLGLMLAGSAGS